MGKMFKALSFMLLIVLIGSFCFAEEKKDLSPNPAPSQQGCDEDNKKTSNSETPTPAPKPAPEKKAANPGSLTPPSPLQPQQGTDTDG